MGLATFRTGEPISAGDVIFVSSSGLAYKASATYLPQASCVGVSIDSAGSGTAQIRVITKGVYASSSGIDPGESRYLSITPSGNSVSYSGFAEELGSTLLSGAYQTVIGRGVSTSGVFIDPRKPTFILNTTARIVLESSTLLAADAMLQEDGSYIDLETATP
jgi:hypothetical protein